MRRPTLLVSYSVMYTVVYREERTVVHTTCNKRYIIQRAMSLSLSLVSQKSDHTHRDVCVRRDARGASPSVTRAPARESRVSPGETDEVKRKHVCTPCTLRSTVTRCTLYAQGTHTSHNAVRGVHGTVHSRGTLSYWGICDLALARI